MDDPRRDLVGAELVSACTIASAEPCTSALMRIGNSLRPASLQLGHHLVERARVPAGGPRRLAPLAVAVFGDLAGAAPRSRPRPAGRRPRARRRSRAPRPAPTGRPSRGLLAALVDQGAHAAPGAAGDEDVADRRVPRWTSTVATGPRPLSSWASMTMPSAGRSGLALRSSTSACSRMASSSLSRLVPLSGRDLDLERVAAHALDDDLVLQELGAHPVRDWRPACRSC